MAALMIGAFYNPHLGAELVRADGIDHLAMADPPAAGDPHWPAIRARYTLLLHDYLGQLSEPLDDRSIERARTLAELYRTPWVAEHFQCLHTVDGTYNLNYVFPPLYSEDFLERFVRNANALRARLDQPLVMENIPGFFDVRASQLPEPVWLRRFFDATETGFLLDLPHVWLEAHYRGLKPERWLAAPYRVARFARLRARHLVHERVVHFCTYSRALARVTGRRPEAVLTRPGFEALVPSIVLCSRETAKAVAQLVVTHVGDAGAAIRYLGDLLQYEAAMMVVEAGPRIWREDPESGGEGAGSGEWSAPETVEGTVLLELAYDLPVVLPELLRPWSEVRRAPARSTKLLVARSPRGRVAVARSTDAIAALLGLADGRKTLAELAYGAGLEVREPEPTMHGLVELGAVRFSTGR